MLTLSGWAGLSFYKVRTGILYFGRPRGVPNRITGNLRGWLTCFIEENRDQVKADWQILDPKDRIVLFEKLSKYSLPTLQSVRTNIEFEQLTDEQLDEIIERLTRRHETE
jgi:hypothetical protein